jgi:hypothetical protein
MSSCSRTAQQGDKGLRAMRVQVGSSTEGVQKQGYFTSLVLRSLCGG